MQQHSKLIIINIFYKYSTLLINNNLGNCAYEAELGSTRSSGHFMAEFLKGKEWLDTNTTLLFFEQTYINIPLRQFEFIYMNRS